MGLTDELLHMKILLNVVIRIERLKIKCVGKHNLKIEHSVNELWNHFK